VQTHVLVFPNLLVLSHRSTDILAIRHVIPEAVARTEIRVYAFGRAGEPAEVRDARLGRFNGSWGPGGRNGADDNRALELVQAGLRAKTAGPVLMARGLGGPEVGAYEDEQPLRAFWRGWRRSMADHIPPADGW